MGKNKNVKEITIKIEGEKWESAIDKAFKKAINKVKVDGFRKGKVPKEIFIKKYGVESLFMDASEYCIEDAYQQLLNENKDLEIVAQPSVDIKSVDEKYIEYVFSITVRPEFKLGKYKNLDVQKETVSVSEEEIKQAIDNMREQYKENIIKDGAVAEGDIAIIDFEGFKDGVPFEGGKSENYSLQIGSNTFIPGFEEQLIGMKVGEEKEINVTFPDDYHAEELKGQPALFKVKVNEIKEVKLPELDKDFFDDLGMEGIDSEEALKKQVTENIEARKEQETENKYIDELLEAIAKETDIDIPDNMVDEEAHRMVHQFADHIAMQGISIDQFYKLTKSSEEDLKEKYKDEALKRVKNRLIIDEIIKVENIKVTEKEIDSKIEEIANKYNMTKEEVIKNYGGNTDYIKYDLEVNKVFDIIKGEK